MAVDADAADRELTDLAFVEDNESAAPTPGAWASVRPALIISAVLIAAMTGLVGWLGFRTYQSHDVDQQHNLYLQVARQSALNLTTISYVDAEANVRRILDSATGQFYDDFLQRSEPFIQVMKQAQATTEGTVTEAAVESEEDGAAQILVAVAVKTSHSGVAEPSPRLWRMRIAVHKTADGARVSDVQFVP